MSGKLNLKTKKAREEWLKNLAENPDELYLYLTELRVQIYRYDFENGYSLIITKDPKAPKDPSGFFPDFAMYDILKPTRSWEMSAYSFREVVSWLTEHAEEI